MGLRAIFVSFISEFFVFMSSVEERRHLNANIYTSVFIYFNGCKNLLRGHMVRSFGLKGRIDKRLA